MIYNCIKGLRLKIVLISPPEIHYDEIETLSELFINGLEVFHLRKPHFSLKQTEAFIEKIPDRFHEHIILHYHHSLLEKYGLKGIHFTESGRKSGYEQIIQTRKDNPRVHISSSFHNIDDIEKEGNVFDYLFLSPVFDSISKKNYKAGFDKKDLETFLTLTEIEVIALGGVDAKKIKLVRDLGFFGAAVLGAIWYDTNPVAAYIRIAQAAEAL